MPVLVSSDLTAVSVDGKIHLFYQASEGHVVEVSSTDGASWSKVSTLANDVSQGTPAITAFLCVKDATNSNKPSV